MVSRIGDENRYQQKQGGGLCNTIISLCHHHYQTYSTIIQIVSTTHTLTDTDTKEMHTHLLLFYIYSSIQGTGRSLSLSPPHYTCTRVSTFVKLQFEDRILHH